MKAKDLKQWQTFYNSNNYLCLIYKIKGGKAHIMNYNGTFYSVSTTSGNKYGYKPSTIEVDEFFSDFPIFKVENTDNKERYNYVKSIYSVGKKNINLLLLC